jgi:hypothetical protein
LGGGAARVFRREIRSTASNQYLFVGMVSLRPLILSQRDWSNITQTAA